MVEAVAQRCRLITDGGRSEKERDAEGSGESGEGSSTVLYIVPGARQISALGALACMVQHTRPQIAEIQSYLRVQFTCRSYLPRSIPLVSALQAMTRVGVVWI